MRSVITFFSPTSYKSAPFFRQENGKFFILHCHGIHYQIVSFTIIIREVCSVGTCLEVLSIPFVVVCLTLAIRN
ncbi:MAG: hypothetical protein MZW92_69405, partial [Comamonadaceae bacterium]|nr:hypothetical protein [Comamonadaceae bacterium]